MRQSFINHGRFVKTLFVEERHLSTNMQSTTIMSYINLQSPAKVMAVEMLLLFWVVTYHFPDFELSIISELSVMLLTYTLKKNNEEK